MIFKKYFFSLALTTLFFSVITSSCSGGSKFRRMSGLVWNTEFHITYRHSETLDDSITRVLDEVGRSLSVFDPNSLVSKVNKADSMQVDRHFIKVYEMSCLVNRLSRGLFDPTISPLIDAWGFGHGHIPTADTLRIDSILKFTGLEKTRLRNGIIYKADSRLAFNFSAIAKGYGCDAIGQMLRRNGVNDFLIEIGGEILMSGISPDHGKWKVGIDRPVVGSHSPGKDMQAVISLTDMGMATSGNYRNFHIEKGRNFGHTILPSTGRPVQTDIRSATVAAPSAMEADALATACMALGSSEAEKMINSLGYPAMFILRHDSVWFSPAMKNLIKN